MKFINKFCKHNARSEAENVEIQPKKSIGSFMDVPTFQRMPFVLSGYRLDTNHWTTCLASVVRLHNETCNIWTHLIGFLYFLYYGINFVLENLSTSPSSSNPLAALNDRKFLIVLFLIACTAFCMFASTAYHIFSSGCHSSHSTCLKLDITSIGALISASFFAGVYFGFSCNPVSQLVYTTHSTVVACLLIPLPFIASSLSPKMERYFPAMLTLVAFTAIVPLIHYLLIASSDAHWVLASYLLSGIALYISGLGFYISRFPEKWFPRRFDIFGNSHQLWHIFVFFAACCFVHGCSTAYSMHIC